MPASDIPVYPPEFLARLQVQLGAEFPAFLAALDAPPRHGLRVNTLKISPSRLIDLLGVNLEPVPWCSDGFLLPPDLPFSPGKHPYHAAGLYYLQEPASMAAAILLDPQPGETVLDLAAAPGGKTTHLASLMGGAGALVANEVHPSRVWDLAENLERWGATNAIVVRETPERMAAALPEAFDRVLLDAPCSGEALFRRSPAARREWSLAHVAACARRQSGIASAAARLVKPGGVLLYVTCTFSPEENEQVVARFLTDHPEFELDHLPLLPGLSPARPAWSGDTPLPALEQAGRIWPHLAPGEGHFFARFRRLAGYTSREHHARSGTQNPLHRPRHTPHRRPDGVFLHQFRDFCRHTLPAWQPPEDLALAGTYLYALPSPLLSGKDLFQVHPGRWLGLFKPGRFEPAHAFALSLPPSAALNVQSFSSKDPGVSQYLRGETLPSPGENGWVLVTVDGYSLGWGKRVYGVLKSHYPRGLRPSGVSPR